MSVRRAALITVLLALGIWSFRRDWAPAPEIPPAPAVRPAPPKPAPVRPVSAPMAVPEPPAAIAPPPPAPVQERLHQELIPREVTILHGYYAQEIVAPGAVFGVDIDGSGFSAEFQKEIELRAGAADVRIKNLRLVTANQIHGDVEVGAAAKTGYVYPKVYIRGLPAFQIPDPFGVVRPGEVLDIRLFDAAADGRAQRFRVLTNLDQTMARQFWVESTAPGLEVSSLQPTLPFLMDGILKIGGGAPAIGESGLAVSLFGREIFRRDNLVSVVLPELGETGLTKGIQCSDPFRRPGDPVRVSLRGTGFSRQDVALVGARIDELDRGSSSAAYASATEIRFTFELPAHVPEGAYGVTVFGPKNHILQRLKYAFVVVPPLWVREFQAAPAAAPGRASALKIKGRSLTPGFARSLFILADEPGIRISRPAFVDESTLSAEMAVGSSVPPGDYWLRLEADGKPVDIQQAGLIKILRP